MIDIFVVDTRDKAIEYYKDSVIPLIQKKIKANGLDKFRKEVEKAKSYMVEKYGEKPEIKDFDEEESK
ncbi:Phage protein (fragment) [Listeria monocytogenes]